MTSRYIGFTPSPTTSSASGIWSPGEVHGYRSASLWPSAPPAMFPNPLDLDPASISGLTGWWDASDSSTLFDATSGGSQVAADGTVARWEDKSGAGNHWYQDVGTSMPARKTGVRNSRDVLRFDGTDDSMSFSVWTPNIGLLVSAAAHTVFAVFKAESVSTNDSSDDAYLNVSILSDGGPVYSIMYLRSSGVVGTLVISDWSATRVKASRSLTVGSWAAVTSRHDSTIAVHVNGEAGTASGAATAVNTVNSAVLGSSYFGSTFHGDLAELITYNVALSATDREAVESYLMAKWGL